MSLTACKECNAEISTTARACPKCGAKQPKTKWWLWIPLGAITLFLAWGAALKASDPNADGKDRRKRTIDLCWRDHETKSHDPATKRFIASTCEMLEEQYADKYGRKP